MYNLSEFYSNSTQIGQYKFNMIGCFVFQRDCHCPNQHISNVIYSTKLMRLTHIWCGICPVTRENVHSHVRHVKPRLHLNIISASFYLSEKYLPPNNTDISAYSSDVLLLSSEYLELIFLWEILRLKSSIIVQNSNNTSIALIRTYLLNDFDLYLRGSDL